MKPRVTDDLPILSERQLNRALLARQLLLERSELSIPRALEEIAGVQNQYALNGYIRLWSNVAGFRRADLDAALGRRDVIQATLMRQTIHLVSRADYWPLEIAIRRHRREWFARVQAAAIGDADMPGVAEAVRAELAGGGALTLKELGERIGGPVRWVGEWLDLVRVPPSGTWDRRRADSYGLADEWVGSPPPLSEQKALDHLLRRYFGAFGPASADDAAAWAGIPRAVVRAAVEGMELRCFADERGKLLLDVYDAPLPDPDTPAPVRFLPTWDATLLLHARRAGILPEAYRPAVFSTKNPPSTPVFLVDGKVAGTWRHVDGRIETTSFEPLPQSVAREVATEAERLTELHRI